jgi:hypothetical protein
VSENEVMACTTIAEKTRAMKGGSRSGARMRGREHRVQQRLRGVRQYQTGEAVDDHQAHAGEQQSHARGNEDFDLRP